jgi:hypothetical protein
MVSAALWQGVEWHMWLYYYPAFAEAIVRNYQLNSDRLVNENAEWPTKYSFLLYEIVANLRSWIRELENMPLDQSNVRLKSEKADHENGNIPKSAILALGQVLKFTTLSDKLPISFRNSLIKIALALYFDLSKKAELRPYANVLAKSLVNGGTYVSSPDRPKLVAAIIGAFSSFDRIPYRMAVPDTLREFEAFLEAEQVSARLPHD